MRVTPPSSPAPVRIGIDLGGTKIAGLALETKQQQSTIRAAHRIPTPRNDYLATLHAIKHMITHLEQNLKGEPPPLPSIGIAIPGSVSPKTGKIQNANSTWLNGKNLTDDLNQLLKRPVRLANDANCFALSETLDGAALGAQSVFGVILGTGVGGGLIYQNQIINGPRSIGGEWGHTPLPWCEEGETGETVCWCGLRGCMESWVSGPALLKDHNRQNNAHLKGAEEIVALADQGDPGAQQSLARHTNRLARGLAMVVNIFDPDVIVLGGGLSNLPHLYTDLPKAMAPYIFADDRLVDIRPPQHGDASGVRGAARLWLDDTKAL